MMRNGSDINEKDILLESKKFKPAKTSHSIINMKISPCVNCGIDVEHKMNLNPKTIICKSCKDNGFKVKLMKIVNCYYCNKEFEISQRASKDYSVCQECKKEGLKNPMASKKAKIGNKVRYEKENKEKERDAVDLLKC